MTRDSYNVVPISLALLLHALMFAAIVVGFDFSVAARPLGPLAIKATLVAESAVTPPPVEEQRPEPEPLPAEPEPDLDELKRIAAEEEKRRRDTLIEQQRLEKIRLQEAERKRRDEEAETERKRAEAERVRQEDIKRQREENERLRRQQEALELQHEIDAEDERLQSISSGEREAYIFAIQQRVQRSWVKPASAQPGLECDVRVQQLPGGEVVSVIILSCNGDEAVRRSIEAAVYKASPLPEPSNLNIFERNLMLVFRPEQ